MTEIIETENMDVQFHKYGNSFHSFSDLKTIKVPTNLNDLIAQLHEIFAEDHVNIEYVHKLMESYVSNRKDWKKYAKFDPHRYTRNLVDEGNGKFNLMILCWNESQGSSIHSHANAHCFLKVIDGSLQEELYDWPNESEGETPMKPRQVSQFQTNQVTYINDSIGLHRVENLSHCDKAVSLHLYSPPYDEACSFDPKTGKSLNSKVTFWSKFGKRTPYGKTGTESNFIPEDN